MSSAAVSGAPLHQPSGFQSKDARGLRLPPAARILYAAVIAIALAATAAGFALGGETTVADVVTFAVLTLCATAAQLFSVRIGRNHSFHTSMLFVAAGALLLPPALLALMVVVQHLPEWVKNRYPPTIQTFNIANYAVAALAACGAAHVVLEAGSPTGEAPWALAGLAAALVLVGTNHLLLATMLRLARGHSFKESGLFSVQSLAADLALAGLGVALALLVWRSNPWIAPVLLGPFVLSHYTLRRLGLVRESEERLRAMFDSSAVGTALLDAEGRMVASNRALVTLLGYTTDELAMLPLRAYTHPDDVQHELTLFSDLLAGKRDDYRLEKRFLAKDGHLVWTQVAVGLVRNADGRPEYGIAMVEDITERRAVEHAVRESEERYRELFENANDMIVTNDLDSRITSVNAAFERVLGYTREEVLGLRLKDVMPPESATQAYGKRDLKLAGELERTTYEIELETKGGQKLPVEVSSRIVRENGEAVGIQAFLRDLSERRKLEDQLRQAQKMEAVGRLAGGIAHDFNNLLTAISGYSAFALERLDKGEAVDRRDLVEVSAAAERAAALTGQLLAFSRKQILRPKLVDPNALVHDLDRMLRRLIDESIEIRIDLDPTSAHVRADPMQLEQVLLNLVVNARDAMPEGGRLTISTETVDLRPGAADGVPAGRYVVLGVSDTGVGVDEDTKHRLFEPFFTTKEVGKGTGLGLAMVYGFVKQSGGYVTVRSEPGEGADFRIYLQPDEATAELDVREANVLPSARGTGTILLVEDEEIVRRLVRQMLERLGYNVVEASNGEHALELAQDGLGDIDLLLTDAVMPKLGGPALAERLRERYPTLKVVFMSGYTEDSIGQGPLESRTQFLQKPFMLDELASKLRDVLDAPTHLALVG